MNLKHIALIAAVAVVAVAAWHSFVKPMLPASLQNYFA